MCSRRVIRRSQVVAPFGVGAIIDIGQESFIVADISRWPGQSMRTVRDSHLEKAIGRPIKAPIASAETPSVAVYRFPEWHFCPKCRSMIRLGRDASDAVPRCTPPCATDLTPMGFAAACKNGHLQDVDWFRWAHSRTGPEEGRCDRRQARLAFETTGAGGGDWSSMAIKCRSCGAGRTLEGLVQVTGALHFGCEGRQPWQATRHGSDCTEKLTVYRRSASNLHMPRQMSALDVVVETGGGESIDHLVGAWRDQHAWTVIQTLSGALDLARVESHPYVIAVAERIAEDHGCELARVIEGLRRALAPDRESDADDDLNTGLDSLQDQILEQEWRVLSGTRDIASKILQVTRTEIPGDWPQGLNEKITAVSLVKRLREVRALLGFARLESVANTIVPVDLSGNHGWVPGVEAWGEGIFIQFAESELCAWESRIGEATTGSAASLLNHSKACRPVEPRFALLHSFAHAVIRRLGFDAGYSSSSIRERIYASTSKHMSGVLIYTADGDSEGSLGGLVRMGNPARFGLLVASALADIAWCSNDPVCAESPSADGHSFAACHACMLTSETSCDHNNAHLDRRTLISIGDAESFFDLNEILNSLGEIDEIPEVFGT